MACPELLMLNVPVNVSTRQARNHAMSELRKRVVAMAAATA